MHRTEDFSVVDAVATVAEMAREIVALRARVEKLERANADLFNDWRIATERLQAAQTCILDLEEGGKGGEPSGAQGEP